MFQRSIQTFIRTLRTRVFFPPSCFRSKRDNRYCLNLKIFQVHRNTDEDPLLRNWQEEKKNTTRLYNRFTVY